MRWFWVSVNTPVDFVNILMGFDMEVGEIGGAGLYTLPLADKVSALHDISGRSTLLCASVAFVVTK